MNTDGHRFSVGAKRRGNHRGLPVQQEEERTPPPQPPPQKGEGEGLEGEEY